MLCNFHTHTTYSDGRATPEEVVRYAIERGFRAIGLSDHAYTPYDLRYCMQKTDEYVAEVRRLQAKYAGKIEVYLGVEEDSRVRVKREDFDYIIGSCHYVEVDGKCNPVDSNYDYFKGSLALYKDEPLRLAEAYYAHFCQYIVDRKPDLVGHFDLPTKFDECEKDLFLHDERYWEIAENAVLRALSVGVIFEVNTGLMARGYKTSPCPHERLLALICKNGGRVALSSDAHVLQNMDACFAEIRDLLRATGFKETYALCKGKWQGFSL